MTTNDTRDDLSKFASETMGVFYDLYCRIGENLSPREFGDKYVVPARDGLGQSADEIYDELESARAHGLSGHDEHMFDIRIGCALVGESIRHRLNNDRDVAWRKICDAQMFVGLLIGSLPTDDQRAGAHIEVSRKGGLARHAKDPKQREKAFIRQCWTDWQRTPDAYKSKAAFARDMLDKCEHLMSTKQIEDWCREWDKEKL